MRKSKFFAVVISLVVFIAFLSLATRLLLPKNATKLREGALVGEYYVEADKEIEHQIIFFGDCEAYECFIPAIIFEECGITSFVRGSPAARIWQSYYLLLDTLRYEKPDVVVLSVYALCHGDAASEAYNRLALDGMRPSRIKLDAVRASMTDGEDLISYVFPILRYHSRWSELTCEDFDFFFKRVSVSHNGYMLRGGSVAPDEELFSEPLFDYALPERAVDYLDKIRTVCQREGIELVLVKSPTESAIYPWYDEWEKQVDEYAKKYGLDYYNLIGNNEIGIIGADYADKIHLNFIGAEKTSRYFARVLKEKYFHSAAPPNDDLCAYWQEKIEKYYSERRRLGEKK